MSDVRPGELGVQVARANEPLLRVRDLHVAFVERRRVFERGRTSSAARAVDGVDLDLDEGEIVALAGESGCGKTTLARAIMGFVRPDRGSIEFRGRPLDRDLRAYRRQVQMVYQDPTGALNPRQTVYDSVAEGLRIHKVPGVEEDLVCHALARAGLRPPERFLLQFPHELSGGQRQRVVIAGALALEPTVIVADEPVSNLDASVRGEILRLLLALRRESRISILIVTHDLALAWSIADRVAVMYLGRIVELADCDELFDNPLHPYTQALLSAVPIPDPRVEATREFRPPRGEVPSPINPPSGCVFHPRCPMAVEGCRQTRPVLRELRPRHWVACSEVN
jgi:oligopeptide transport system ATP-binding protein